MPKLMNCAHCGSDNVKLLRTIEDNEVLWHVECLDCGISTTSYPEPVEDFCGILKDEHAVDAMTADAIDCAVRSWNSRSDVNCDACECDGIDVEALNDDDLMHLYKACVDALTAKARGLMHTIKKVVEDDHD